MGAWLFRICPSAHMRETFEGLKSLDAMLTTLITGLLHTILMYTLHHIYTSYNKTLMD